jgi:hypothetical protein
MKRFVMPLFLLLLASSARGAPPLAYDQIYPYYVEACALSQIREKEGHQDRRRSFGQNQPTGLGRATRPDPRPQTPAHSRLVSQQ